MEWKTVGVVCENIRPHPGPLPQERGKRAVFWKTCDWIGWKADDRTKQRRQWPSPLPGGEGQGEGGRQSILPFGSPSVVPLETAGNRCFISGAWRVPSKQNSRDDKFIPADDYGINDVPPSGLHGHVRDRIAPVRITRAAAHCADLHGVVLTRRQPRPACNPPTKPPWETETGASAWDWALAPLPLRCFPPAWKVI